MRQEIECVSKLSQYCQRQTTAVGRAAELFFEIACKAKNYSNELLESAMEKLINLLLHQDRPMKLEYINLCYDRIENGVATYQCVRLMHKILDQIPKEKMGMLVSGNEIANDLINTYNAITVIIFDLSKYSELANAEFARSGMTAEIFESNEVLGLPFSHRSQVAARLNLVKLLLTYSATSIKQEHLDSIWDILMSMSHISTDQHLFFDWFKVILQEQGRISYDLIQSFFESRVCAKTEPGTFEDIRRAGFECIQQMFLAINEQDDKVHILSLPSASVGGVATKLEFVVLALPHTFRGIEMLWRILQDCDKKNVDLAASVIDLITRLYHSVADTVTQDHLAEYHDEFCQEWFKQLKLAAANANSNEEEKKLYVKSATAMLKSFLSESERNGIGALRSHSALDKGQFITKLILQNLVSQQSNMPRLLELNTHSNMTLWDLRALAAKHFKISARRIELKRSDANKPVLNDQGNGKLLRDFKIESYEII